MSKLDAARQKAVIAALVEGNSISSISLITRIAESAILSLQACAKTACSECRGKTPRNLPCDRLQLGEIGSFCYTMDKKVPK